MESEDGKRKFDAQVSALLRGVAAAPSLPIAGAGFEFGQSRRFRTVRRLGAGGFGVVWLVTDLAVGADVALKTLPASRPDLIYRLKREFRTLADIRHENLVSFFELVAEDDLCFFTMEYVPGDTFRKYVRGPSGVDEGRLRAALAQLVRGLTALHGAGRLHRDIKPSNVLVTAQGRLVLLDFGLATELEDGRGEQGAELSGTPEYMAPEHLRGEPLSPASDWYAVGVMLFEAIAGRRPFQGTRVERFAERQPAEPPALVEQAPGVSADLIELTRSLLHPVPSRRPTAAEIARALGLQIPGAQGGVARGGEPRFLGREAELEALRSHLRAVVAGRGGTVLVEGPSGVGKTALVQHFLARTERAEAALVLRGRCFERERVPYQGIDSLVEDLCRRLLRMPAAAVDGLLPHHLEALVQLFPAFERVPSVMLQSGWGPPGSPDRQELRRQAFGALREILARASAERAIVVHLDDLQWADRDAGSLLAELVRPPDAPRMLLILSSRSEDRERSPCLQALQAGAIAELARIDIGPLPPAEAERLAGALLGPRRQAADAARVAAEAGGNPFFIEELARFAATQEACGSRVPLGLEAALRQRLDRLPRAARALLEVVAVAGHPIGEGVAHRATGLPDPPWDSWAELRGGNLVRFTAGGPERRVEPLHDRIREAVVAALPPPRAVECHRGLASALEEAGGADPEVLARHHAAAGRPDRAHDLALEAGEQADRALAFDRAARLYRWALQLSAPAGAGPPRLTTLLAAALANAGRGEESARAYLEAAEQAAPADRSALRQKAAQQYLLSGHVDRGRSLAAEELRAAGLSIPVTPRQALASLLGHRALIRLRGLGFRERPEAEVPRQRLALLDQLWGVNRGLSMVDVVRGADLVARYLLLALRSGEVRRVAQGVALEAAHAASARPLPGRTDGLFERLERLDARLQDPQIHGRALLSRAVRAYCRSDWRAALPMFDEAERIFREQCSGVTWEIWTVRTFETWALYHLGEWAQVEQRVHAHLAEARERGNAYALAMTRLPFGLVAWLAHGDIRGARENAREAIAGWSVQGFHLQHSTFLQAECLLDLYAGDGASAWARIRERWPALRRSLVLRIGVVRAGLLHVRTGCALAAASVERQGAERRRLLGDAARGIAGLERIDLPFARPLAALRRAALATQRERAREAESKLEAAIAGFEALEMRAYLAAARRRLAQLRGRPAAADFMPGQPIADPQAVTAMLAPGFREGR